MKPIGQRGKFVVLEGNQGLGKTTQVKLLEEYLVSHRVPSKVFYFPNYQSFFGKMAKSFLRGELGKLEHVSPYFTALIFANDRALARDKINRALALGKLVVCDRWVTSNIAIQATKLKDNLERDKFANWVKELEYNIFAQSKPDLTIYLRGNPEVSITHLISKRTKDLANEKDIEEASQSLIIESFFRYEEMASNLENWTTLNIEDVDTGNILSITEVHLRIVKILKDKQILPCCNAENL